MENAINVSVSPLQLLLSLAFQIWLVAFPIILIRKVNYLTALVHDQLDAKESTDNDTNE